MKLYVVYWTAADKWHCGQVLVALPDETPMQSAVDMAMSKAIAMDNTAEFTKIEELADRFGVLWTEEWYA